VTDSEQLIRALRERLKIPERRADRQLSASQHFLRSASAEAIEAARQEAIDRSSASTEADRRGESTRELHDRATADLARMKAAAPLPDSATASREEIAETELLLGFQLPAALARIYSEVANGGFGPGYGLLPIGDVVRLFRRLRAYDVQPSWPEAMLPISDDEGIYHCIDRRSGRIMRFDPERLNDDNSNVPQIFEEVAPDLEDWLERWLAGPPEEEAAAFEAMRERVLTEARENWRQRAEAYIEQVRKQSSAERAKLGLKDDWEEQLRRGLLGSR
jgi:hypothetical protein